MSWLDDNINTVLLGDCLEILKELPDNSIHAIVCDPPYGLEFQDKDWDKFGACAGSTTERWGDGKQIIPSNRVKYHKGLKSQLLFQTFIYNWACEAIRVLRPGGHLLAFGGSRTYHRMACGVEDAGFEIRDSVIWLYGSGFGKGYNLKRSPICSCISAGNALPYSNKLRGGDNESESESTLGALDAGALFGRGSCERCGKLKKEYIGFSTNLKPAHETIVAARKPLAEITIAKNVLKWGTGAINVEGCRVGDDELTYQKVSSMGKSGEFSGQGQSCNDGGLVVRGNKTVRGRLPANLIHDGSDAVEEIFPETKTGDCKTNVMGGMFGNGEQIINPTKGDSGSASRYFYCAKPSRAERDAGLSGLQNEKYTGGNYSQSPVCKTCDKTLNGTNDHSKCSGEVYYRETKGKQVQNNHPTVKPLKLMRHLVRLVTPPSGIVLDPFCGSGTTLVACIEEGFDFIGMDKMAEYITIAELRVAYARQLMQDSVKDGLVMDFTDMLS